MAQDQAVDQALSHLGNVAASILEFRKRSDILMKHPGFDDTMLQAAETLSPDASAALGLTMTFARQFESFSNRTWVQSINPDLEQITAYIQQQRQTIREQQEAIKEQQETISALQQKVQDIDPATIARQCREEVVKSLMANNAPLGRGGYLDRIAGATVGPQSSLGKISTATVGPQSSLEKIQTTLESVNTSISGISTATVGPQSSLAKIETAVGSKTLLALSNSLDDILNAVTTQDAGGNTTTVMHHVGNVVGAVYKRDVHGNVTNVGDLLTEVHSATVGQDSTLSKVHDGLDSSTFFSAMNNSLNEIVQSISYRDEIRMINDTTQKTLQTVTDLSNASSTGDDLRHKSPRAHESGRLLRSVSNALRTPSSAVAGPSSATSSSLLPRPSSRPLLGPSASPSSAPSTPTTSGTAIALRQRRPEDERRLREILRNVPNVITWVRPPLDVIFQLDIRVGDGQSNIAAYPPLPSGLQIPTIMRLAAELSAKFSPMTDTKWKEATAGVAKSSCLYTKIWQKTGADGFYTACDNCQEKNRMCLRKAKTKENVLVTFIAPLPTPVDMDPLPTDGTEELRYWVPRPTQSMS
ncbi:hypothetical protein KCU65_g4267, partial [Aureobasidium melanogenum]